MKKISTPLLSGLSLTAPFVMLLLIFAQFPSHAAGVIYVNGAVPGGSGDGSDWTNAYSDLQTALAAATAGDEIWVAQGIYTPGDQITDSFTLIDQVGIYGGFDGSEAVRSERDWWANRTILSGDITRNDAVDSAGVVTDTAGMIGPNSYHVVTANGVSPSALLDGFTITAGQATGTPPFDLGGGLRLTNSDPTLNHIIFAGNTANGGGGMYTNQSDPTLTNVTFFANTAIFDGGGLFNHNGSDPIVMNGLFVANMATVGGGMLNLANSNPTLVNVALTANSVSGTGARGGGIANTESDPTLTNSLLWGNSGPIGANLLNTASTPSISYSLIEGSGGSASWNISFGSDVGNNIDLDPLFVDPTGISGPQVLLTSFQLQSGSPAIDAGQTLSYTSPITSDLSGNDRIQNQVIDLGPLESDGLSGAAFLFLPFLFNGQAEGSGSPTPTSTATAIATGTPVATPTGTPAPTETPAGTATPTPTVVPATLAPGTNEITIDHVIEGETVGREVYIQAPAVLDSNRTYPILFAFHGAGGTGMNFVNNSYLKALIDAGEFIGVYPTGHANDGSSGGFWNLGTEPTTADDIEFVGLIMHQLTAYSELDTSRIYGMGYSNGSGMINRLGKTTTYFRAIAPLYSQQSETTGAFTPPTTLSVFQLNGAADTLIPINGGDSVVGTFLSAEDSALNWVGHFSCDTTAVTESPTWGTVNLDSFTYSNCDNGHEIRYYIAFDVAHSGFQNEAANQQLYAEIWAFFQDH